AAAVSESHSFRRLRVVDHHVAVADHGVGAQRPVELVLTCTAVEVAGIIGPKESVVPGACLDTIEVMNGKAHSGDLLTEAYREVGGEGCHLQDVVAAIAVDDDRIGTDMRS